MEGCRAAIGFRMGRAGLNPTLSSGWSLRDCLHKLFQGSEFPESQVMNYVSSSGLLLAAGLAQALWLLSGHSELQRQGLATGDHRFESCLGPSIFTPVKEAGIIVWQRMC